MSVAIVAPQAKLPTSAPATATPAASAGTADTATPSVDFASLLLGQLASEIELPPAVPESTPLPADGNDSLIAIATEPAPQDAASMLAALGMAPLAQTPKAVETPQPGLAEDVLVPAGSSTKQLLPAPVDAALNALKTGQAAEAGSDSGKFTLPVTPVAGEQAAKVAVADFALPKAEARPVATLADQIPATGIAPHTPLTIQQNETALKIESPVHGQNWASDFSQKVVWLANNDRQFAQLSLNPPQMGPIEISLNLNKDGASALFVSQNAEVREAIETALPRLREMFASAGIELGQANVSAESFRQQAGSEETRQGAPRWMDDNAILGGDSARSLSGQAVIAQRGNGLVDTFA